MEKLSRIRSPLWRRLIILLIALFYFLGKLHPRSKAHWAGASNRPRRLERVFITFVLVGGFFVLETQQLLLWATAWGSLASAFVIWQSFYKLKPRKQFHWINK